MECVAYMRVSTEKQAEEGNGLDSQRRDIENFCRKNELIVSDWYIDDGYTGANMDRPELQRLVNDCSRKRVKCVVAFKLDRLSRSMIDGLYLIERVFQPNNILFKCVHDSVSYDSPMEQAKMKDREIYLKELSEDVTQLIADATPEERSMVKNKMQVLTQKIG